MIRLCCITDEFWLMKMMCIMTSPTQNKGTLYTKGCNYFAVTVSLEGGAV